MVSVLQPSYPDILAEFPAITKPRFEPDHVPAHGVRHVVPMSGPPVFARARPLFADKLKKSQTVVGARGLQLFVLKPCATVFGWR